jgi:hypothetical protein
VGVSTSRTQPACDTPEPELSGAAVSDAALVRCGVERVAGGFGKLIVVLSLNHWYRSHLNFEFAGNCEVQRVVLRGDGAGGALPLTLTRLHRCRKSYCSCSRSH